MLQGTVHQAAGHSGALADGPVYAKPACKREIDFYLNMAFKECATGSHISHWIPVFMGTLQQSEKTNLKEGQCVPANGFIDDTEPQFLVLENLYYPFRHPSILDIKLGSILTDSLATAEKRERLAQVSKATTSGSLSLRVCGMKVYSSEALADPNVTSSDGYLTYNKYYGGQLTKKTFPEALNAFFCMEASIRKHLLTKFLQRLQLLYNCLLDTEIRVFSGSLLFIYEGDSLAWTGDWDARDPLLADPVDDEDEPEYILSSLHMIDFAHAEMVPGKGYDENILQGVENLISIFEGLLQTV